MTNTLHDDTRFAGLALCRRTPVRLARPRVCQVIFPESWLVIDNGRAPIVGQTANGASVPLSAVNCLTVGALDRGLALITAKPRVWCTLVVYSPTRR